MKKVRLVKQIFLTAGLLCLSICIFAQTGKAATKQAPAHNAPISLAIRPVQSSVHAGDQILVNIMITNISNQPRLVDTQIPTWITAFDVRDKQGQKSESRRGRVLSDPKHKNMQPGDDLPVRGGAAYMLQPGKNVVVENVPVPDLYDLSKPGTYTIQVRRPDGLGQGGVVYSNSIVVKVTP